jgi:hypothetical protein
MAGRHLEGPLATTQRLVVEAVQLTSPIVGNEELTRRVEAFVRPSARGMPPAQRLEVYREQFWQRHLSSLDDDFPTLAWATGGRDAFHRLATEYLGACPPQSWNLQGLGACLPDYVESHRPWCDDAIARDAARLDWAFMEAVDAPDAPPFDARALAAATEDGWLKAHVVFHPALRALAITHPLHEVRDAARLGSACERPPARETHVIVWRDAAYFLRTASLEPLAFELLVALKDGAALGEACEMLTHAAGVADLSVLEPKVGEWFQAWTASGWVSSVAFG